MRVGPNSIVTMSISHGADNMGLVAGEGTTVVGNVLSDNDSAGLLAGAGSAAIENVFANNLNLDAEFQAPSAGYGSNVFSLQWVSTPVIGRDSTHSESVCPKAVPVAVEGNKAMRILSTAVATIILAAITAAPAFAQRAINQGQALAGGITPGDAPGFPVTLSAPGHYRLTGNLLPPATCGVHGIEVTSRLVTIDLNGFAIIGPGTGCSDGIRSVAWYTVVVNGTVRNFAIGLNLAAAATEWTDEVNRVERVKAYANASVGIAAGSFSIVVDCIANQNGGTGIGETRKPAVEKRSSVESKGFRGRALVKPPAEHRTGELGRRTRTGRPERRLRSDGAAGQRVRRSGSDGRDADRAKYLRRAAVPVSPADHWRAAT